MKKKYWYFFRTALGLQEDGSSNEFCAIFEKQCDPFVGLEQT